jgi:N,N'-diacetyllegionaminate synthase
LPIGFSDHSEGILLAPVAAAMGAVLIEKHFTLDRRPQGPSVDPESMKVMIQNLRNVEASLGDGRKRPCSLEEEGRLLGRRSIVSAVDIGAFETISPWMLAFKRPGRGIEPRHWQKVVGMKARRSICKDTILQWEDLIASAPSNQFGDSALSEGRKSVTDRAVENG